MQKILRKRVLRDLKKNTFRYAALGCLIILCMYLIISLVGAGETIVRGVEESAEENQMEDGQFTCFAPLSQKDMEKIRNNNVQLEKMFYLDYTVGGTTLRVFKDRESINKVVVSEGKKAENADELVLEKRYAAKNEVSLGDEIQLGDQSFTVVGIGSSPDYDAPYKNLSDTIVDSKNFGTVFVTKEAYDDIKKAGKAAQSEEYLYAYRLKKGMSDEKVRDLLKTFKIDEEAVQDDYFQEYWDRTVGQLDDMQSGVKDLKKGAEELYQGLRKLNRYKNDLNMAPKTIFYNALEQVQKSLQENGFDVTLTEDNFESEIQKIVDDKDGVMALTLSDALDELKALKTYKDSVEEYTDGVQEAKDGAEELKDGVSDLKEGTDDYLDEIDTRLTNMESFVKCDENIRTLASVDDQQINISAGMIFGVIILILLAYVISVFVVHNIEKESSIIGTLYALGVRRRDLMFHYLSLPVIITTVAGILGFLAGISFLGIPNQMQDCITYYSVPPLDVIVPPYLIVYGIIMPPIVSTIVNTIVIRKKLSHTALSLMRNETKKQHMSKLRLHEMKFEKMFRIRQMVREARAGITVFFGMFIALLCMMISLNCYELCVHVRDSNIADTKYEYMYTLKYPEKEVPEKASPAYAKTLKKEIYGYNWDVTVLGIEEGNPYFDLTLTKGKGTVVVSSAMAQKYDLKEGDTFVLNDEEEGNKYAFEVTGICEYAPAFYVFMDLESARDLFGESDDFYNVLFSDEALDIPAGRLYATTTKQDIEKSASIFVNQMQSMIITINVVSTLIFIIVMYLMMKVMIDRSAYSISLMKVFGFRDKEVRKLYLNGNFYIILAGIVIHIPLTKAIMDFLYPRYMVSNISTALELSFEPWLYVALVVLIFVCYFAINRVLVGRLKKMIPAEVLKNRE